MRGYWRGLLTGATLGLLAALWWGPDLMSRTPRRWGPRADEGVPLVRFGAGPGLRRRRLVAEVGERAGRVRP